MTEPLDRPAVAAEEAAHPPSVVNEAENVLRRGSPLRFVARLGAVLALAGAVGASGWLGWRALRAREAKGAPMVSFDATRAAIGNDMFESEAPRHEVPIKAFALDKAEVTTSAYRVCVEQGGCARPAEGAYCNFDKEDRAAHPINCVTFEHARAFCAWAGKRLPTEKEWERAARVAHARRDPPRYGRGEGLYPWGTEPPTKREANVCGRECRRHGADRGQAWPAMWEEDEDPFPLTAPVGSFKDGATPDGLLDMAGNVWEWTTSAPCAYPDETCGNTAERVIRGGGFLSYSPRNLEVTTREVMPAQDANHAVGFRCAR
jgi:formylglycine-generating enzyme required for sulfatase activity